MLVPQSASSVLYVWNEVAFNGRIRWLVAAQCLGVGGRTRNVATLLAICGTYTSGLACSGSTCRLPQLGLPLGAIQPAFRLSCTPRKQMASTPGVESQAGDVRPVY